MDSYTRHYTVKHMYLSCSLWPHRGYKASEVSDARTASVIIKQPTDIRILLHAVVGRISKVTYNSIDLVKLSQ